MKNLIFFITFLIISSGNLLSQSSWFWQHPYPQGNTLKDVDFKNNKIVSVGSGGTVLFSTNCGSNWSVTNDIFEMKKDLSSVYFVNQDTGWTCGQASFSSIYSYGQSKILKTTNSGINWIVQHSDVNIELNSIKFINNETGWCAGDKIFKTTNSGENWFQISYPVAFPIFSINFINQSTGWIAGWLSGSFNSIMQLYRTSNGGDNWNLQYSLSSTNVIKFNEIFFFNEQNGFIIGNERLLKTTNSGENWNIISENGNSIYFTDASTGWIVSNVLKKTTNGGLNWFVHDSISGNKIRFNNSNTGIIIGNAGKIYKSINNGSNWGELSYSQANHRFDIFFTNKLTGYSVGDIGKILKTTNGGKQWYLVNKLPINNSILSVYFVNEYTGWVGTGGGISSIYATTNGGINWTAQLTLSSSRTVRSILFTNQQTGFASGNYKELFMTTNGGINWNQTLVNVGSINKLTSTSANNIYACGGGLSIIIRSTNDGVSWFNTNFDITPNGLEDIDFVNSVTGFACGLNGKWYKTNDSGNNWHLQPQQLGNSTLLSMQFLNEFKGAAVNLGGMVFYTSDSGNSWDSVLNYSWQLNSIFALDDTLAWICGFEGSILCTYDYGHEIVGFSQNNSLIPNFFTLHQNYPNPFNPVTKIKFDIPNQSNAKIIIYDLLGKEISTLVNEHLKPGSYSVDWDGTGFASGVYFYSLVTNEFVETKRMVLVK